jgi:hypothetical protein
MRSRLRPFSTFSRREFLAYAGTGVLAAGSSAGLCGCDVPIARRHERARLPRAKNVIFCVMEGGQSHLDLFDPKPALTKYSGQPLPASVLPKPFRTPFGTETNCLMPSRRTFTQHGHSGLWFSDLLPHTSRFADDFAVVRSCHSDAMTHSRALRLLSFPTGMGLPRFIAITDDRELTASTSRGAEGAELAAAADIVSETTALQRRYGLDDDATARFGSMCLTARRLIERGVRFVQLHSGTGGRWDAHHALDRNHSDNCRSVDKPVAALLSDLKSRGMLEETLLVWVTEFGRTPFFQGTSDEGAGRDHNPWGFTALMAGGGVKGGQAIGATDEFGLQAIEEPHHVRDIHASVLWLLGLGPERVEGANLITKLWA